ncbi:hypothetical protein BDW02DRAFT_580758 [Decorospora gaudefroyi]|uniref:Uncharacterized protein n=1 Tax=Decorospora gaudefroyi TaxID=184978 RepID=A0A6A5K9K9_9PLEO|nr:hypothetical protein BDW02DRAFT_580758 [Decorospora gaudefroyi]
MATNTVATSNRKFNWADDDEDDFDFDAWKAMVDTSAPSVNDLGPLQLPATEDDEDEGETYTLTRTKNERTLCPAPTPTTEDMSPNTADAAPLQDAEPIPAPPEQWYQTVLHLESDHQVQSARYDHITRAIGFYYEGKEVSDAPAYPGVSSSDYKRKYYSSQFKIDVTERGGNRALVYRHSPLALVTYIEDAEQIDDVVCVEVEDDEEELTEWEERQIAAFEKEELDTSGSNEVQRVAITVPIDSWSKEEGEVVKVVPESWDDGLESDDDDLDFSTTGAPSTKPIDLAFVDDTELEFNAVVFDDDSDDQIRDEGYVSSSPPLSTCDFAVEQDQESDSSLTETRLSMSSVRRKTQTPSDTMAALETFRQAAKNAMVDEDAVEDDDSVLGEELVKEIMVDTVNDGPLEAIDHPQFEMIITGPTEHDDDVQFAHSEPTSTSSEFAPKANVTTLDCINDVFLSASYDRLTPSKTAPAEEEHEMDATDNSTRGILDLDFTFPQRPKPLPIPSNEDEPATTPKVTASPDLIHTIAAPSTTDYLAGAVSSGWLYMSRVPWTKVGIVVAGVAVGGLVGMARHRR